MSGWRFPGTPILSTSSIDWQRVLTTFEWLSPLATCPQDPIYHAEGDVLTHTRMVCEALMAEPAWQRLNEADRSLLFAAALLHDVAKPQTTQVEQGRIRSPGHAQMGARQVQRLLYHRWHTSLPPIPFAHRQQIAALVRFHGLPLWFWEKESPARSVILASQEVRMDLLALLAKADVLGRECADQSQLLERIALFEEFCTEQNCFEQPYPFANSLSRFLYFQHSERDPAYAAFDDTRGEVILMSGLPGAGKDTWIQANLLHLPVISLDAMRSEMDISPTDDQSPIIVRAKDEARQHLRTGRSFVWNATNITRMIRTPLIRLCTDYKMRVRIVYIEAHWQELLRRNQVRSQPVPEEILLRLADKLEPPRIGEAWEVKFAV